MIQVKYIILLIIVTLAIAWACTPIPSERKVAKGIVESLNKNDVAAAEKHAGALSDGSVDFSKSAISDLCAVSISLMKLSQSTNDGNDYAAQALKYYDTAMLKDSVSANSYFEMLGPEDYHFIHLLRQLSNQVKVREAGIFNVEDEYEL